MVYVRGQSLYFEPKPDPTTAPVYKITYQPKQGKNATKGNFESLSFQRALTVSRGIQVIIRSWNSKQAHGFTATYPAKAKSIQVGKSTVGAGAQIYSKTVPNLTQAQADQMAQSWYAQLVAHEMKFEDLKMPGDNALDITSVIAVSGTGTDYDQTYFPDSINRSIRFDGGYSMTIAAKNHATDSETGVL